MTYQYEMLDSFKELEYLRLIAKMARIKIPEAWEQVYNKLRDVLKEDKEIRHYITVFEVQTMDELEDLIEGVESIISELRTDYADRLDEVEKIVKGALRNPELAIQFRNNIFNLDLGSFLKLFKETAEKYRKCFRSELGMAYEYSDNMGYSFKHAFESLVALLKLIQVLELLLAISDRLAEAKKQESTSTNQ